MDNSQFIPLVTPPGNNTARHLGESVDGAPRGLAHVRAELLHLLRGARERAAGARAEAEVRELPLRLLHLRFQRGASCQHPKVLCTH